MSFLSGAGAVVKFKIKSPPKPSLGRPHLLQFRQNAFGFDGLGSLGAG
jgi:hypothetical protein